MKLWKSLAACVFSLSVIACGGGGGDSGREPFPGNGGGDGGGNGGGQASMTVEVQRAGAPVTQISSSETVKAVATVRDASGDPVQGVLVTFSEEGSLLTLAPLTGTALTNEDGEASIDIAASSGSQTGATTIAAEATLASESLTASESIQITAGGSSGNPAVPAAVNFVGSNPADTAIVIKGSGGSGRTESAILTFRVVDATNAPIEGAEVDFAINTDNGGATISPNESITNSEGLVTTIVSSGVSPASIVVKATSVSQPTVSTQSDTLLVSNSVPAVDGFEIVAENYNLDGKFTGDTTTISAFVRDEFGNPVPDGVAVSFTADFGAVAGSTLGGCLTVNGMCDVEFRVQDPRGNGIATVFGSVRVGNDVTLPAQLQINMSGATGTPYIALDEGGDPVTQLQMSSCKETFELLLSDGAGRATAAGTTIVSGSASTGVAVEVTDGSPVLDQLAADFPPTPFAVEVDLTSDELTPACNAGGTPGETKFFRLNFTTPNGIVYSQRVDVIYPQ